MHDLRVELTRSADTSTLLLVGEVDLRSQGVLDDAVTRAMETPRVVVDLRGVTFLDSTGISSFLQARQDARSRGVAISFLPGPSSVMQRLRIAGADEVLGLSSDDESSPRPGL